MSAAADKSNGVVARLREQIRKLEAEPRRYLSCLRTGMAAFDGLFPGGGLPLGQAVELWGEAASGRTSLALRAVAAAGRERRLCAWVDGPRELYPPAARALGADLERLLIVRPSAPAQLVWTAVQLLRSGAFACVVLDLTHTGVRPGLAEGRKLHDAAQKGGALLLLLTPPDAPADGMARLRTRAEGVHGLRVEKVRARGGADGAQVLLPWEALYPGRAPVFRYAQAGPPIAPGARPPFTPTPLRLMPAPLEESTRHRVMPCSVHGHRPGRDAPLPPLFGA
jgi:recombination protein RecA